jgi:V8-like Glu-specific endopeptidase
MDDVQEIDLSIVQRQQLESAFLNAFDHNDLSQMLRLKMGIKIGEELDFNKGLKFVVTNLLDIAIGSGWLVRLLLAAREYRPGNIKLKKIVEELQVSKPESIEKGNIEVQKDLQENHNLLEKIVRKRAPFISFDKYMTGLAAIGRQIARIEIPSGTEAGTGWLVAPDLILTAYHVVENIHKKINGLGYNDLFFRFDYTTQNGQSRICAVKENWLIDHAPYSEHDLQPSSEEPASTEMDYALIALAEKAGDDVMNDGTSRGWIEVPEHPVAMSAGDFVMIPQHPNGRPLELAFGDLLKYNKAANRVQYDTNTEPGSSGSPCFDISLQPFALHHASGPAKNLAYNQAVPLREIIKLMKQRNVNPFWKKVK